MKRGIEEKLHQQLSSKAPFTEARVVYILVECRKLLDLKDELKQYPKVRFHCDWALHTSLDRGFAKDLLRLFDQAYPFLLNDQPLPQGFEGFEREIDNVIHLRLLKQEFLRFLNAYNLPKDWVLQSWTKFLLSYAGVVEDCPLTITDNSFKSFKNIKSVTVNQEVAKRRAGDHHSLLYRISWTCLGLDDKACSWDSINTIR